MKFRGLPDPLAAVSEAAARERRPDPQRDVIKVNLGESAGEALFSSTPTKEAIAVALELLRVNDGNDRRARRFPGKGRLSA